MAYDYVLLTKSPKSEVRKTTYQELIRRLGMEDEIVHGAPLKEGGVPQVQTIQHLIQTRICPGSIVRVFHIHGDGEVGEQIL